MILERQGVEGWGKSVVERLSADLQREFPGVGGFSIRSLWYMRQFYQEYHESLILQPLVGEIGWGTQSGDHGEMQRSAGTRILYSHDAQVRPDEKCANSPD
jgi:hypothetical protein